MSLTPAELERFVTDLAATPERWRHAVRHATHVRVYEQIWNDEEVNAWVICWSEEQDTGFHDHDESSAAIAVISARCARTVCASASALARGRSAPARSSPCPPLPSTACCMRVTPRR